MAQIVTDPAGSTSLEDALRRRLGVPPDAAQVMIVTESTHWDPDWLCTSDEYFRFCVQPTLDRALDALTAEPRRIFSVECTFFPQMYWQRRPDRRDTFRDFVNQGRLRFTGSGVTTPDTLIPEDELLLRDLLLGQEWLRTNGMTQEPRVLYLPDSFGHSPCLPSLLDAAGVPYAAVCRIDGMRFPGAEFESASHFPVPGSSAATLTDLGTADFLWRGPDGSEVLTHWHSHGYGHGDMLASGGFTRALGLPLSWWDRREDHVAARIERFVDQLSPLARTPYLLLAIGLDFVRPIPRLVDLIDRWNGDGYARTGMWLVNAGLDDYLDLVGTQRDLLPTIDLDPNPYWTGFYSSRPHLKRACRDLGRRLIAMDHQRARAVIDSPSAGDRDGTPAPDATAWWVAAMSNHHDFVTGTSPDRVSHAEQWPLISDAQNATNTDHMATLGIDTTDPTGTNTANTNAANSTSDTTKDAPEHTTTVDAAIDLTRQSGTSRRPGSPTSSWSRDGAIVTVTTRDYTAVFDENRGGSLVRLTDSAGRVLIDRPSMVLIARRESGGLWRMGNEFPGGTWSRIDASSDHPATVEVTLRSGTVAVAILASVDGRPARIVVEFADHAPGVLVRAMIEPRLRRTITLQVALTDHPARLIMHQPGGVIERPLQRRFNPTYWPLHSFAGAAVPPLIDALPRAPYATAGTPSALRTGDYRSMVVATATPTAIQAAAAGTVEVIVARNAPKEFAYRVVPLLAPAVGHESGAQRAEVTYGWTTQDLAGVVACGRALWEQVDRAAGRRTPSPLFVTDDDRIEIISTKLADRGKGIVIRLRNWAVEDAVQPVTILPSIPGQSVVTAAWRTDSNERDIESLAVADGRVRIDLHRYLTTVRLRITRVTRA